MLAARFLFPAGAQQAEKTPSSAIIWGALGAGAGGYAYLGWRCCSPVAADFHGRAIPQQSAEKSPVSAASCRMSLAFGRRTYYIRPVRWRREPGFDLLPLQGQMHSVMELAHNSRLNNDERIASTRRDIFADKNRPGNRRRRCACYGAVDDQYRHGGCRGDGGAGESARPGRIGSGAHHGE